MSVFRGDDVVDGGGDQYLALQLQQLGVGNTLPAGEIRHRAAGLSVSQQLGDIQPIRRVNPSLDVTRRDYLATHGVNQPGRPGPDVPEPLYSNPGTGGVQAVDLGSLLQHVGNAAAGRRLPAQRAAEFHGFARDDGGGMAVELTVGVHHPGHRLSVGTQVRCGNITVGRQEVRDVQGVAASEPVQLPDAQAARVALNAALGASVGKLHQGRFPGHQRGQGPHLVQVRRGMIPHAPFVWPAGAVVLNPVPAEHLNSPIVHPNWDLYLKLAPGPPQHISEATGQIEPFGSPVKKEVHLFEGSHCLFQFHRRGLLKCAPNSGGHGFPLSQDNRIGR